MNLDRYCPAVPELVQCHAGFDLPDRKASGHVRHLRALSIYLKAAARLFSWESLDLSKRLVFFAISTQ
jgi:hypothetical protein